MQRNQLSMTDYTIATDMLFESKSSVKDIAAAITETTSFEVRAFLTQELRTAIQQHEQIYNFVQANGVYDAYNVPNQLQKDIEYVNRAINQ